ncbi:hypothetical protein [Dactylosporangium cerinum]
MYANGSYYLVFIQGDHIGIVAAPTSLGLRTAPEHRVWADGDPYRCCNIWAPEAARTRSIRTPSVVSFGLPTIGPALTPRPGRPRPRGTPGVAH